jgi:hypothetical protein
MARLEEAFGTRTGHKDAIALVEQFLDRVEPRRRAAPSNKRTPRPPRRPGRR